MSTIDTTARSAMKLALEALETKGEHHPRVYQAITALREALNASLAEQPAPVAKPHEQEPVAWMREGWGPDCGPYIEFYRDDEMGWRDRKEWTALYTSPPAQRTWVGLTDEEILIMSRYDLEYAALIGEVQRKLKEKNSD